MIYRLCYVEPDGNKAYFTSNLEKQWGDDWDDKPYEHNAGTPYNGCYEDGKRIPIKLKEIFFELPWLWEMPCSNTTNSNYSVEDINHGIVPWITKDDTYIFAGISYNDFIKQIEELGGKIYIPKKKGIKIL